MAVFLLLIFSPFILWYLEANLIFDSPWYLRTRFVPALTIAIWCSSLVAYMSSESGSKRFGNLAFALIWLDFLLQCSVVYLEFHDLYSSLIPMLEAFGFLALITTSILMYNIVKQVFYARTNWFLFLELFIIPMGVFTLTPDVQNWEKGDKK